MKKTKSIIILFLLIVSFGFSKEWKIESVVSGNRFYYRIKDAPVKYCQFINSLIIAGLYDDDIYIYSYPSACDNEILFYLNKGNFKVKKNNNNDEYIFLSENFLEKNFPELSPEAKKITKKNLTFIWEQLSKKYAGFSEMEKKGFKKKDFFKIKNFAELKNYLDKYLEDCHFNIQVDGLIFSQKTAYDEGTIKSKDPDNLYFEKETSNAYYVRFTSCVDENTEYFKKLEIVGYYAWNKDFIILDARSNYGGSNHVQYLLRNVLNIQKYKGTVIVLQDNWCFSSGEVWSVFGTEGPKFKTLLVGTHSGGMQNYGPCEFFKNEEQNIVIYFGTKDFRKDLPKNYLGDGKGYEPDIWATTQTMASVLTGLGVDVTGITFQ